MKPITIRVKKSVSACPICKQELSGNNSILLPYTCKCGIWQTSEGYPWDGEYEIIKIPK